MIYFLYVKTHKQTGLKYLGQTQKNPFKYKGSGLYWKAHLRKYGNDVITEIIGTFDFHDELKVAGLYWSDYWNVIDSNDWANLRKEMGDGGSYSDNLTEEGRQKLKSIHLGKPAWNKGLTKDTDIRIKKQALAQMGKPSGTLGKPSPKKGKKVGPHSLETKKKQRLALLGKPKSEQHKRNMQTAPNPTRFKKGNIPWNKKELNHG